jgi:hypothetical protein
MMEEPQLESQEFVSPLSSDAFERLLGRAALNLRLRSIQATEAGWDEARPELAPIGEAAGRLAFAAQNVPTAFAGLVEIMGVAESLLSMAVGWLARENKITIEPHYGDCKIGLKLGPPHAIKRANAGPLESVARHQ